MSVQPNKSATLPCLLLLLSLLMHWTYGYKADDRNPIALLRESFKYWHQLYEKYEEEMHLGYCWADYLLTFAENSEMQSTSPSMTTTTRKKREDKDESYLGHSFVYPNEKRTSNIVIGTSRVDEFPQFGQRTIRNLLAWWLKSLKSNSSMIETTLKFDDDQEFQRNSASEVQPKSSYDLSKFSVSRRWKRKIPSKDTAEDEDIARTLHELPNDGTSTFPIESSRSFSSSSLIYEPPKIPRIEKEEASYNQEFGSRERSFETSSTSPSDLGLIASKLKGGDESNRHNWPNTIQGQFASTAIENASERHPYSWWSKNRQIDETRLSSSTGNSPKNLRPLLLVDVPRTKFIHDGKFETQSNFDGQEDRQRYAIDFRFQQTSKDPLSNIGSLLDTGRSSRTLETSPQMRRGKSRKIRVENSELEEGLMNQMRSNIKKRSTFHPTISDQMDFRQVDRWNKDDAKDYVQGTDKLEDKADKSRSYSGALVESRGFGSSFLSKVANNPVIVVLLRTLGMFVQVGRMIMNTIESSHVLACTRDYLWTKFIKWIS